MRHKRSTMQELIDLGEPHYSPQEYEDCMHQLDAIGRWLGGDLATWASLKRMPHEPTSILDVGCGGGLFTIRLAKWYPNATVVGIDINEKAIAFANKALENMKDPPKNVRFEWKQEARLTEQKDSYDVILSTLVCHHLTDKQLVDYIIQATAIAKKKVIINDLHRHPIAYYGFKFISPLLFPNRLVKHDGPLSVSRAFRYHDWISYLTSANLAPSDYKIKWQWAFRWLVEINKN